MGGVFFGETATERVQTVVPRHSWGGNTGYSGIYQAGKMKVKILWVALSQLTRKMWTKRIIHTHTHTPDTRRPALWGVSMARNKNLTPWKWGAQERGSSWWKGPAGSPNATAPPAQQNSQSVFTRLTEINWG